MANTSKNQVIAAVLIKSPIGAKPDAKKTLLLLNLHRINTGVLLPDNPTARAMLQIAKDYLTWGAVDEGTVVKVLEKRGKLPGDKKIDSTKAKEAAEGLFAGKLLQTFGIKKYLRLHPPRGGFKLSLKRPVSSKGEAGYRKKGIGELLERMI
jgi:large subunit ribosomal protein L30